MKNLFTSEGRINRSKYIHYNFIAFIICSLINLTMNSIPFDDGNVFVFIFISLLVITYLIFYICLIVQRLHDLNRSGIHILLLLIPIYDVYLKFIILFKKGTNGPNQYGEDPLGIKEIA
ncbi:DUF805 domain-containing protein [Tepidibacter mesophilus]|uniref:DUF805 domain-containing protein n=1 Tax=Tepidibacter mesophilus TaxID=655607 RepID=UPI000C06E3C3|nr:DUF805 domain-containing protein [Tepidibacter mesophilus]